MFAGACGIVSAFRRSYSSLFIFLALSLLSALLGGYLIGYFIILVVYYRSNGYDESAVRPQTMRTTWGLIGTNLALSLAITLFSIVGFVMAFCGIAGCQRKGLHLKKIRPPYVEPTGPKGQVTSINYFR
jgi:hypothetical protein